MVFPGIFDGSSRLSAPARGGRGRLSPTIEPIPPSGYAADEGRRDAAGHGRALLPPTLADVVPPGRLREH